MDVSVWTLALGVFAAALTGFGVGRAWQSSLDDESLPSLAEFSSAPPTIRVWRVDARSDVYDWQNADVFGGLA